MSFKCQSDSFLQEFTTKVVSCTKTELKGENNVKDSQYEVILQDTILFPEGGGQPCDYGFLNEIPVEKIIRRGNEAIHFVHEEIQPNTQVLQKLNWSRRFDHMQQHSGQHLISALLEKKYNFKTVSWWLGEDVCYIELDTPALKEQELVAIENEANEAIRNNNKVTVEILNEKCDDELTRESKKGLPEDHQGDIRVIKIDGIDVNMCCGTHVTSLAQLQVIKLLYSEKSKRKNNCLMYFLVGNRVIKRLDVCLQREQKLTELLNNNAVQHVELVSKLQKSVKVLTKNLQLNLKEHAINSANQLKATEPKPVYTTVYKKEADMDYMNTFLKQLGKTNIFVFLCSGDPTTPGCFVINGNPKDVEELGPKICELLKGKGAGKQSKYQAKFACLPNMKKIDELLFEHFKSAQ